MTKILPENIASKLPDVDRINIDRLMGSLPDIVDSTDKNTRMTIARIAAILAQHEPETVTNVDITLASVWNLTRRIILDIRRIFEHQLTKQEEQYLQQLENEMTELNNVQYEGERKANEEQQKKCVALVRLRRKKQRAGHDVARGSLPFSSIKIRSWENEYCQLPLSQLIAGFNDEEVEEVKMTKPHEVIADLQLRSPQKEETKPATEPHEPESKEVKPVTELPTTSTIPLDENIGATNEEVMNMTNIQPDEIDEEQDGDFDLIGDEADEETALSDDEIKVRIEGLGLIGSVSSSIAEAITAYLHDDNDELLPKAVQLCIEYNVPLDVLRNLTRMPVTQLESYEKHRQLKEGEKVLVEKGRRILCNENVNDEQKILVGVLCLRYARRSGDQALFYELEDYHKFESTFRGESTSILLSDSNLENDDHEEVEEEDMIEIDIKDGEEEEEEVIIPKADIDEDNRTEPVPLDASQIATKKAQVVQKSGVEKEHTRTKTSHEASTANGNLQKQIDELETALVTQKTVLDAMEGAHAKLCELMNGLEAKLKSKESESATLRKELEDKTRELTSLRLKVAMRQQEKPQEHSSLGRNGDETFEMTVDGHKVTIPNGNRGITIVHIPVD